MDKPTKKPLAKSPHALLHNYNINCTKACHQALRRMSRSGREKGMLRISTRMRNSMPRIICWASCCSLSLSSSSGSYLPLSAAFITFRHHHISRPSSQFHTLPTHMQKRGHQYLDTVIERFGGMSHIMLQSTISTHSDTETAILDDDNDPRIYFDEQQFAVFKDAIEEITSNKKMREFTNKKEDLAFVKEHLLDKRRKLPRWDINQFILSNNGEHKNMINGESSYTRQRLKERSQLYLDHTHLTPKQYKQALAVLTHLAEYCAKHCSPQPLYVAWEKILEAGMIPLSRILSTYLYVFSLEDESRDTSERDVAAEVAMFHDALYKPTEKTITLLVKSLVSRGDAEGAEALLDSLADGPLGDLRHRTTSPILKLYCSQGNIDSALRLYHRMRTTSRVKMDGATYADFIASVAQNGYFASDSNCILGAEELGYSESCGQALLNALLTEMSEDVLDISEESARVLHAGFASGFKGSRLVTDSVEGDIGVLSTLCDNDMLVANRVAVDKDTAKCPATGTTLRLIVLEQSQRIHVHDTLIEMAREKSLAYTASLAAKGRAKNDTVEMAERATEILKEFSEWLDARDGKPYTAILDGANIAYFGWGRINVHQLKYMVNALERQGEYPLVVFPKKYTFKKFHLRQGVIQVLNDEEREFLDSLKEKGQMYVVPPMCLDDLCKYL